MRYVRRSFLTVILGSLVTIAGPATPSSAQSCPTRTVKFILTLRPGSVNHIAGLLLSDRPNQMGCPPFVILNKPGRPGLVQISAFGSGN